MNRFHVVVLACGLLTIESYGATIHVPADSPTIQSAINTAAQSDVIVVAPGTYHETINFLGKSITLRSSGGADVTTIDATGLSGSVVTCISGEGPDTVLDGFTITGGTGTNIGGYTAGGGMYNDYTDPTVIDCSFFGNSAGVGGGIYNNIGRPTFYNCAFTGDKNSGMYNVRASPTLTKCTFIGNLGTFGGGMYNAYSTPTLTDCVFQGNKATNWGGGMFNDYESSPIVKRCTFNMNTSPYYGGGMFNDGSNPTIINCSFGMNKATYYGGGMFNSSSNPMLSNCTFSENVATIWSGGGICNVMSSPTVTNCTFRGNRASYSGGGIFNSSGNPAMIGCMFIGNTTTNWGGGMFNSESPTVTNCTFSGNTATNGGAAMYNEFDSSTIVTNCILSGDSLDEIRNNEPSSPIIRFSSIQGGLPLGAVDGGGNINLDPMFIRAPNPGPDGTWDGVDDDYGDLRLRTGSPCIDAGDPEFVAQPGETDLEGHARVLCGQVDMGAYEFGVGDYDCDQEVNLKDFVGWGTCMLGPENGPYPDGCEAFDGNSDRNVDLRDFAIFQNSLFAT